MQSYQLVTKRTSWYRRNSFGEESGKVSLIRVTWKKEIIENKEYKNFNIKVQYSKEEH